MLYGIYFFMLVFRTLKPAISHGDTHAQRPFAIVNNNDNVYKETDWMHNIYHIYARNDRKFCLFFAFLFLWPHVANASASNMIHGNMQGNDAQNHYCLDKSDYLYKL